MWGRHFGDKKARVGRVTLNTHIFFLALDFLVLLVEIVRRYINNYYPDKHSILSTPEFQGGGELLGEVGPIDFS